MPSSGMSYGASPRDSTVSIPGCAFTSTLLTIAPATVRAGQVFVIVEGPGAVFLAKSEGPGESTGFSDADVERTVRALPHTVKSNQDNDLGLYLQDRIKAGPWIAVLGLRHDWVTAGLQDAEEERHDRDEAAPAVLPRLEGGQHHVVGGPAEHPGVGDGQRPEQQAAEGGQREDPLLPADGDPEDAEPVAERAAGRPGR